MNTIVKVPVLEYERGWGSKVDDHMICLDNSIATKFVAEFNSKNTDAVTPDWYMVANSPEIFEATDSQIIALKETSDEKMWLSQLKDK